VVVQFPTQAAVAVVLMLEELLGQGPLVVEMDQLVKEYRLLRLPIQVQVEVVLVDILVVDQEPLAVMAVQE
jgi:hypothetical protein